MKKLYCMLLALSSCFMLFAQERGALLSETVLAVSEASEIAGMFTANGVPPSILPAQYGVEEYKITYQTVDADGSLTFATGVLAIPIGYECPKSIGVYNHGTFSNTASIPSNLGTEHLLAVGFATSGYVGLVPDLIGYGDSPGFPNYQHAKTAGTANVDMIRAARHFCAARGIELNGQVFITGYSQGGHAAMAAHREIETLHADEITVTACAPLSGAYDMSGVQTDFIFSGGDYEGNIYMGYIIMAFKEIYPELVQWEFSDVFFPPYDTILYNRLTAFDTPLGTLNGMLPTNPTELIKPDILNEFLNDPNHPFRQTLRDNDVYDWAPLAPVQISYCEADMTITYQNAILARNTFEANGSTNALAISRGSVFGHGTCILPAILSSKNWFDSLMETCLGGTGTTSYYNQAPDAYAYPNPAHQYTTFMVKNGQQPIDQIRIFDLAGKQVAAYNQVNAHHFTVSLENLQAGMYIAEITADKTTRIKLSVQ